METSHDEDEWKDEDFLALDDVEEASTAKSDKPEPEEDDMDVSISDGESHGHEDGLPPWETNYPNHLHPLTRLHNEIVSFCRLIEPRPAEIAQRQALVDDLRQLVVQTMGENAKLQVFGSQATGLFLPSSDVDVVILTPDKEDDAENHQDPLLRMERALQTHWKLSLIHI